MPSPRADSRWDRRHVAIGLAGLAIAAPGTWVAVQQVTHKAPTRAAAAGADGTHVVAVVDGSPITRKQFDRWLTILDRTPNARTKAMDTLIGFSWVEQEARQRGISATDAEVTKQFLKEEREHFKTAADYERFLHTAPQTEDDLRLVARTELLGDKIESEFQAEAGNVQAGVEEWKEKWRHHTVCAPHFVTSDCATE